MEQPSRTHPRYDGTMRTNIEIDDELMARALRVSGLKTKKDVVHAALVQYVADKDVNAVIESIIGSERYEDLDPVFRADYEKYRIE